MVESNKYVEKSTIIEAFQYDGDFKNSKGEYYVPNWAVEALEKGEFFYEGQGNLYIKTYNYMCSKDGKILKEEIGKLIVNSKDFILKEYLGEMFCLDETTFKKMFIEIQLTKQ